MQYLKSHLKIHHLFLIDHTKKTYIDKRNNIGKSNNSFTEPLIIMDKNDAI